MPTAAARRPGFAPVVIDLDRMGRVDRPGVRQRQSRPMRMRDGDESPGIARTPGDLGPGLLRAYGKEPGLVRGREIGG